MSNTPLEKNGIDLSEILTKVNALPSGGGITPTGNINITENGTYDVTEYASAEVNVGGGADVENGVIHNAVDGDGFATEATVYGSIGNRQFGVQSNGTAFFYGRLNTLHIAPNCTKIWNYAFRYAKVVNVDGGEGITAIDGSPFEYASALTNVTLKGSFNLNAYIFGSCGSLQNVTLGSIGKPITYAHGNAFGGCTQTGLTITVYTTVAAKDALLAAIRNGATNATIIIKDSTTGEIIVTSTP